MIANRTIRIMLLVGSNGMASACVEGEWSWRALVDCIGESQATSNHIVTVTVPEPVVSELEGQVHGAE